MDLDGLSADTGVTNVWHGHTLHRLVTSAYNAGVRSARVIPLRPPSLLAGGPAAGGDERQALEARIALSEQVRRALG